MRWRVWVVCLFCCALPLSVLSQEQAQPEVKPIGWELWTKLRYATSSSVGAFMDSMDYRTGILLGLRDGDQSNNFFSNWQSFDGIDLVEGLQADWDSPDQSYWHSEDDEDPARRTHRFWNAFTERFWKRFNLINLHPANCLRDLSHCLENSTAPDLQYDVIWITRPITYEFYDEVFKVLWPKLKSGGTIGGLHSSWGNLEQPRPEGHKERVLASHQERVERRKQEQQQKNGKREVAEEEPNNSDSEKEQKRETRDEAPVRKLAREAIAHWQETLQFEMFTHRADFHGWDFWMAIKDKSYKQWW